MSFFSCIPSCNRQIDSLDKRQANLQTVPQEIARYARSLEEVLLDMNHIKGLESESPIFRLPRLRILGLSDNDIYRVPPDISRLVSLEDLNLSRNDISDLPDEIRECKMLMRLELSSNPFTRLPQAITQLYSLSHLGLNDISLTQLPTDIGSLTNLRSLEVRENLIRSLPPSICQLVNLKVLDLGQNEIDQLPSDIGSMASLEELYIDANDLEMLPDQITRCRSLEQIDVSENKLNVLPEDIGELSRLTDLNVSQNCLQIFPSSIGRLRRLSILKAEKNAITHLTPAIGSCDQLNELFLTENLLTELPSTIGNLRYLKTLNVDKNQLISIPTTIGGCCSLSVLSLRDNQLTDLPMDIGKCEGITVLDVCSNRLSYLPFTIKVLFKMSALWLSENQTQALLKLQEEREPRAGVKVLTCYLLPQQSVQNQEPERTASRSFLGGPKVHFGDQGDTTMDEENKIPIGEFHRHDTPHPKPHSAKLKKNTIDGHVIHHEDEQQPASLALKKKPSDVASPSGSIGGAATGAATAAAAGGGGGGVPPPPMPRSALRQFHQPDKSPSQRVVTSPPIQENNNQIRRIRVLRDSSGNLGLSIAGGLESTPFREDDKGLFVSKVVDGGPAARAGLRVGDKLIRVGDTDVLMVNHEVAVKAMHDCKEAVELSVLRMDETPIKEERLQTTPIQTPVATPDVSFSEGEVGGVKEMIAVVIKRDKTGSPGFAVAGGVSKEGLFISYITKGGAADVDGKLMIGDRVVSIDGTTMKDTRHDQAVALLTGMAGKDVHLVVHRDSRPSHLSPLPTSLPTPSTPILPSSLRTPSPLTSPVYSIGDASWNGKIERVDLHRDGASLGLSVVGGSDHVSHPFGVDHPGVFISKIASHSAADRSGRLRVGDRILQVNDVDVREAKHATAVDALKATGSRVRLMVCHDAQPAGMAEIVVRRRGDGPLGMSIHGGVNAVVRANPNVPEDEGIFIDRVEAGSISEKAGLVPGQRIIEVNGESLLGASQLEAAASLKKAHELRLLVCHGYNGGSNGGMESLSSHRPSSSSIHHSSISTPSIPSIPPQPSHSMSPLDISIIDVVHPSSSPLNGPSSPSHHSTPSPISPILSSHELSSTRVDDLTRGERMDTPLAASSPLPAAAATAAASTTKPSKMAPPVAPKPTLRMSQAPNVVPPVPPTREQENPERLAFSSKLSHFEKKMEEASSIPRPTNIPEKKRLLNEVDIARLKEAEEKRGGGGGMGVMGSPANEEKDFLAMIEESQSIRGPGSIRTKKAEKRAIAAGLIEDENGELTESERMEAEFAKREKWRKERLASVVGKQQELDEILSRITPIPKTTIEEKSSSGLDEIQYADEEL